MAAYAISRGATPRPGAVHWHLAGNCENPHRVERKYSNGKGTGSLHLDLDVRCRRCRSCLRYRAYVWRERAVTELRLSARTWFTTLTLSPDFQYRAIAQAELHARSRGVRWAELDDDQRLSRRHAVIGQEITRFLKRLRKNAGVPIRYLLVLERHKSGDPHYHLLLHEPVPGRELRHRHIKDAWRWGFSQARLVADDHPEKASSYVAKYISKTLSNRVRASRGYGSGYASEFLAEKARNGKKPALTARTPEGTATAGSVPMVDPRPQAASAPCWAEEKALAFCADFIALTCGRSEPNELSGCISSGLSELTITATEQAARAWQATAAQKTPRAAWSSPATVRPDDTSRAGPHAARSRDKAAIRQKAEGRVDPKPRKGR